MSFLGVGDSFLMKTVSKDFLTLQDYSASEIWEMLKMANEIKDKPEKYSDRLSGKAVLLLFQKASTRTRVSFEVAIRQLGGLPISLGWSEAQLGRGETIADTARVLNRYVQCVVARVYNHSDLEEMASYADIPIVNALSDLYHPCQAVADLFTIWEHFGSLKNLKMAYIGDANNVCNSLLIGCSKIGVNIDVACPPEYKPKEKILNLALKNAEMSESSVKVSTEPVEAVTDAHVVYTDVFVSMGFEEERPKRLRVFLPKYRVATDLFRHASEDAIFMHCLPVHRGEEVTDDVIDGPRSLVWDQAENRLHTAKAILSYVL